MPSEQHARDMATGRKPLPTSQSSSIKEATSSSLGWGVQGSAPVDKTEQENTRRVPQGEQGGLQNENENADEQLATFAEGEVADAVERKSGTQKAPGETVFEEDYTEGLER